MRLTTLTLAASLALTGAALAQAPAVGRGTIDDRGTAAGDVPATTERGMGSTLERLPGPATGSTTTNPALVPPGAGPAGTGMPPGTGGTAGGPGGINR